MKKKLLLSVLAAGLVLPSAAALANGGVTTENKPTATLNADGTVTETYENGTVRLLDKDGKLLSEEKKEDKKETSVPKTAPTVTPLKAIVKDGEFQGAVPDYNLTKEEKPAAQPAEKTASKAANKEGKKVLPKTSAVK